MNGMHEEGEFFLDIPDTRDSSFTKEIIGSSLRQGNVDQLDLTPHTIDIIIDTIADAAAWIHSRYDLPSIIYKMMPKDESSQGHSDHFAFNELLSASTNQEEQEEMILFNPRVLTYIGKYMEFYPENLAGCISYIGFRVARTHYLLCPESESSIDFTAQAEKIYGKQKDNKKLIDDLVKSRIMYNANNVAFAYIQSTLKTPEEFREQVAVINYFTEVMGKFVHADQSVESRSI